MQERLDKAQEETEQLRLEDTDRQDHVEALRKQLDAVKQLNITLSNDLQVSVCMCVRVRHGYPYNNFVFVVGVASSRSENTVACR